MHSEKEAPTPRHCRGYPRYRPSYLLYDQNAVPRPPSALGQIPMLGRMYCPRRLTAIPGLRAVCWTYQRRALRRDHHHTQIANDDGIGSRGLY